MKLENKVAWITGGASSLGAAAMKMFVEQGCKVLIYDRDADLGHQVAAQMGPNVCFFQGDVTNTEQNQAALKAILGRWGKLDILLNSAGIGAKEGLILSRNPNALEDFKAAININLIGTYDCLRLAALAMAENTPDEEGERGVIINVSSGFYRQGMARVGSYGASKAAVSHYTAIAALELGDLGIRVAAIAPGAFDTPILGPDRAGNTAFFAGAASFPKRLGKPVEFAKLVCLIIDDPYINGSTIEIGAGSNLGNWGTIQALTQALAAK